LRSSPSFIHDAVKPRLLTMTFTTAGFARSSSWLFGAPSYKMAPKGPHPSSLAQHDALAPSWHRPSRPGELHPEALTDPYVNLSIHTARATQRRLPPPTRSLSSSGCPLALDLDAGDPLPSLDEHYLASLLLRRSPPLDSASVLSALGFRPCAFSLASLHRFSSSVRKPKWGSRPLNTGHRMASR